MLFPPNYLGLRFLTITNAFVLLKPEAEAFVIREGAVNL